VEIHGELELGALTSSLEHTGGALGELKHARRRQQIAGTAFHGEQIGRGMAATTFHGEQSVGWRGCAGVCGGFGVPQDFQDSAAAWVCAEVLERRRPSMERIAQGRRDCAGVRGSFGSWRRRTAVDCIAGTARVCAEVSDHGAGGRLWTA
jgi:hypothetical protein